MVEPPSIGSLRFHSLVRQPPSAQVDAPPMPAWTIRLSWVASLRPSLEGAAGRSVASAHGLDALAGVTLEAYGEVLHTSRSGTLDERAV